MTRAAADRATTVGSAPSWDRPVAAVLLLALGVECLAAGVAGGLMGMVGASCGGDRCDELLLNGGIFFAVLSPVVAWVVSLVVVVLRARRGASAWWVPLVAAVVVPLLVVAGGAVASLGVPA